MLRITSSPEFIKTTGAIVGSIVLVGLCPIFYRFVEAEVVPVTAVFNRFIGSSIVLGFWVSLQLVRGVHQPRQDTTATVRDYGLLLVSSLLFWLSQISWAWSLTRTPVAISDLLHSLIPIFVILCAWLIEKKAFTRPFITGTSISMAGSLVIGLEHLSDTASHKLEGDIAALASAVLIGVYVFLSGYVCEKFSSQTIMLWICLTGTVLSLPIVLLSPGAWFPTSALSRLSIVGLIVVTVIGQTLFLYGLQQVGASLMAVLKLLEPVISGFAAWLILAETLTYLDLGAMGVILAGVYLSTSGPQESLVIAGEPVEHSG